MNLTPQYLIKLSQKPFFALGPYGIISQDPSVISDANRNVSATTYLPMFITFWAALERATGYRWKNTSYIRKSPSHELGHSFDLAPDIAGNSVTHYAVTHMSDPVLYKRVPLIAALQTLRDKSFGPVPLGVFIEPDHLHIQVLKPNSGNRFPTSIVIWPVPKPIYSDTFERMKLAPIEG